MSVDCQDFERVAQCDLALATEMNWRNSASRAYYSAYHAAQDHVDNCPDNSHLHMGAHERLSNRFELENSQPARSISYILVAMKRVRHQADYDIADGFSKDIAVKQLAQLPLLQSRLQAFAARFNGPPAAAAAGI